MASTSACFSSLRAVVPQAGPSSSASCPQESSSSRVCLRSSLVPSSGALEGGFAGARLRWEAATPSGSRQSGRMVPRAMAPPKAGGKAKKVVGMVKLALEAGKATPAPPVGPALGAKGVNIMAFCKEYNAKTADKPGFVIPVEITVYDDRSFTFILKAPPASVLLKKAAGVEAGSDKSSLGSVGTVTRAQLEEIAKTKLPDLNCTSLESAMKTIAGTARNMGIAVEGFP